MKKYYNKWRVFLSEEKKSFSSRGPNHYTIDLKLRYDEEARLYEDIFNQVRAIPGVTIISVSEASQTTGVDQKTVPGLINLIKKLNNLGVTIITIEHNMRVIMSLSNRILALDRGKKIAFDEPKEIQENEKVIDAYLGGVEVATN